MEEYTKEWLDREEKRKSVSWSEKTSIQCQRGKEGDGIGKSGRGEEEKRNGWKEGEKDEVESEKLSSQVRTLITYDYEKNQLIAKYT